jgi:hypothetical protein
VNDICAGAGALPRAAADSLPESSLLGAGGRPGACRCAGSILIHINDQGLSVAPIPTDHDRVIAELQHPMCRMTSFGADSLGLPRLAIASIARQSMRSSMPSGQSA